MSSWTEEQRASIRAYMGFPSLFHQIEPRLENAINAVQAIADGGALPTADTQLRMINALNNLNSIDDKIVCLYDQLLVSQVGDEHVHMDAQKAIFVLEMQGRRWITQLAIPLGTKPFRDYYSPLSMNDEAFGGSLFPTDLG